MSERVLSTPMNLGEEPRILIILLGALGDIARGIRILRSLKLRYPQAQVTWLVEKRWEGFLSLHPDIDEIFCFEKSNWWKSIKLYRKFLRASRASGAAFDVVLDMSRHAKSGLLSYLSGAPLRIGFHPKNAKEGNHFFQTSYIPEVDNKNSKVYHYGSFLHAIGAEAKLEYLKDSGLDLSLLKEHAKKTLPMIAGQSCVSLVLGSSWVSKDWHKEGYLRLIRRILNETDFHLLLQGDPGQADFAQSLRSESLPSSDPRGDRIHALAGKTTLQDLTALLAFSELAIGPDSGPGHISSAVGTPYISLFGPTAPERVAPFGCDHLVVSQHIDCMPCARRVCPGRQHVCMQLLSVDDIMEKVYRICRGGVSFDYQ